MPKAVPWEEGFKAGEGRTGGFHKAKGKASWEHGTAGAKSRRWEGTAFTKARGSPAHKVGGGEGGGAE